ncbi:MAG: hypothetical protein FD123_957 [Bacteroidetes bacterium]|nr:MAG: hypothetical protein FD123_957 [Bacteroidota bacterium]
MTAAADCCLPLTFILNSFFAPISSLPVSPLHLYLKTGFLPTQFYNSPFRILGLTPDTSTPDALQQVRKQLLAEFELQQDKTSIEWNGVTLDKQQALVLVEELRDGRRLNFHKRIAEDPLLLQFLENGEAVFLFHTTAHYYEQDFIDFCGPYIHARLSDMLASAFECNDVVLLTILLQPHPLISPETAEASMSKLRSTLVREKEEIIAVRRRARFKNETARISNWAQHIRSGSLERLPFSLSQERDKFITAFVSLLWLVPEDDIRVSEKIRLLDQMQQMTVSEKTLHRVTELRNRLGYYGISTVSGSRGTGIALGLPLVLLLLWILAEKTKILDGKMSPGDLEALQATATFFYWVYVCVMIGVTIRHVFQVLRAKSWIWIFILILLNVVAMPMYWAIFMRHPKDKWSNRIGLLMAVLIVGLAVLANVFGEGK